MVDTIFTLTFLLCLRKAVLAGGDAMFSTCPFVHLSVRPSVRSSVCPSVCPSVCLSVCLFVRSETREHDILKMNELILIQIDTSGPQHKDMK